MPYCPQCEAEYREGLSECADCRVALVPALPEPPGSFRWAHLGTFTKARADAIVATLEAAGIETQAHGGELALLGLPFGGEIAAGVQILVREDQLADARAILDAGDR